MDVMCTLRPPDTPAQSNKGEPCVLWACHEVVFEVALVMQQMLVASWIGAPFRFFFMDRLYHHDWNLKAPWLRWSTFKVLSKNIVLEKEQCFSLSNKWKETILRHLWTCFITWVPTPLASLTTLLFFSLLNFHLECGLFLHALSYTCMHVVLSFLCRQTWFSIISWLWCCPAMQTLKTGGCIYYAALVSVVTIFHSACLLLVGCWWLLVLAHSWSIVCLAERPPWTGQSLETLKVGTCFSHLATPCKCLFGTSDSFS